MSSSNSNVTSIVGLPRPGILWSGLRTRSGKRVRAAWRVGATPSVVGFCLPISDPSNADRSRTMEQRTEQVRTEFERVQSLILNGKE